MKKIKYKNNNYSRISPRNWIIYSEGKWGGCVFTIWREDIIDILEAEYKKIKEED
jgi:hypothetical protein